MAKSAGKGFPKVRFYDQYLVDLYDRTWNWIKNSWKNGTNANGFGDIYAAINALPCLRTIGNSWLRDFEPYLVS